MASQVNGRVITCTTTTSVGVVIYKNGVATYWPALSMVDMNGLRNWAYQQTVVQKASYYAVATCYASGCNRTGTTDTVTIPNSNTTATLTDVTLKPPCENA